MFIVVSAALLVLAAFMLNPLCFRLSPVALVVVLGYSYMKRFSPLAHLVLGLGLGIAPVGAWLAVTGQFAAFPLWLSAAVMFWVAGFDTIYACQDAEYDRRVGLHSLASRLGVPRALMLSRVFHVLSVAFMAGAFRRTDQLGIARGEFDAHRQGLFRDQQLDRHDAAGRGPAGPLSDLIRSDLIRSEPGPARQGIRQRTISSGSASSNPSCPPICTPKEAAMFSWAEVMLRIHRKYSPSRNCS